MGGFFSLSVTETQINGNSALGGQGNSTGAAYGGDAHGGEGYAGGGFFSGYGGYGGNSSATFLGGSVSGNTAQGGVGASTTAANGLNRRKGYGGRAEGGGVALQSVADATFDSIAVSKNTAQGGAGTNVLATIGTGSNANAYGGAFGGYGLGGGIYADNDYQSLSVIGSSLIDSNKAIGGSATTTGTSAASYGGFSDVGGEGEGGGIFAGGEGFGRLIASASVNGATGQAVTLEASSLTNNTVQGGVATSNSKFASEIGGEGAGGGIFYAAYPNNRAPVAVDDSFSFAFSYGGLGAVYYGGSVLANDFDPDGRSLSAVTTLDSAPAYGGVVLNADGTFTYTPTNRAFKGQDSFSYHANDGRLDSNVVTVVINVYDPNEASATARDDAYSLAEDKTLSVAANSGVLANDFADGLTPALVSGPAHGALTFNADGSFTYTPDLNFSGTDTFSYNLTDGSSTTSNTATVSIVVVPLRTLTLKDSTVSGNNAVGADTTATGYARGGNAFGGAVAGAYLDDVQVVSTNLDRNAAAAGKALTTGGTASAGYAAGGALYGTQIGDFAIYGGEVDSNKATGGLATGISAYAGGGEGGGLVLIGKRPSAIASVTATAITNNLAVGGAATGSTGFARGGYSDAGGVILGDFKTLSVVGADVENNAATAGAATSTYVGNVYGGGATGGGIESFYIESQTIGSDTLIAGNTAKGGNATNYSTANDASARGGSAAGGGYSAGGTSNTQNLASVLNSTISNNSVQGGNAFLASRAVAGRGGSVRGGDAEGAGIYTENTSAAVTASTVSGNAATAGGATTGWYRTGAGGDATGGGLGRGGSSSGFTLNISSSTFSGNSTSAGAGIGDQIRGGNACGGGLSNDEGVMTVADSTFSGNKATAGAGSAGYGGSARGGGIASLSTVSPGIVPATVSSSSVIASSTIVLNSVQGGAGGGLSVGGGVYSGGAAPVAAGSNLIAGNSATNGDATASFGTDVAGAFVGNNHNLLGRYNTPAATGFTISPDGTDYTFASLHIVGSTDLEKLKKVIDVVLAANGGPTLTHALALNSPALGRGSNPLNLSQDQRGFPRITGKGTSSASIDIGAVQGAYALIVPGPQSTPKNVPFTFEVGKNNAIVVVGDFSVSLTVTLSVSNGTLSLFNAAPSNVAVAGNGTNTITLVGSGANITSALAKLKYAPNLNYVGPDALQLELNPTSAPNPTNVRTVPINVIAPNGVGQDGFNG